MEDIETLCKIVILEQFGEAPSKVVASLVSKGKETLQDIIRDTGLTFSVVKNSLLLLIHQNIVLWSEDKSEERTGVLYSLPIDNLLLRFRFAKFICYAADNFGPEGELIIEVLLSEGRLTKADMLKRVLVAATAATGNLTTDETSAKFQEVFFQLIRANMVSRVESSTSLPSAPREPIVPDTAEKAPKKRKAPSKKSAKTKPSASVQSSAQSAPIDSRETKLAPRSRKSKKSVIETEGDTKEERLSKRPARDTAPGAATEDATPAMPAFDFQAAFDALEPTVAWRVNYDKFNLCFRKEACVAYVLEKSGPLASCIVRAILELHEAQHDNRFDENTGGMHVSAVIARIPAEELPTAPAKAQLVAAMDLLCRDKPAVLRKLTADTVEDGVYCFLTSNVVSVIKQRALESVINSKYGNLSLRIFRLLLMKKQLEQKQIADMAMVPIKDARARLYQLVANDYIQLQEAFLRLRSELIKTMKNLKLRLHHENARTKGEFSKPELPAEGDAELSADELAKLAALHAIEDRVEQSLQELDTLLMTAFDF